MNKEKLKTKIDFTNIGVLNGSDYLKDSEGHFIVQLTPLHFKIIEYIKQLETRIDALETQLALKGVK